MQVINPQCACAARVSVVVLCVYMYVCMYVFALICRLIHWNHKRETNRFIAIRELINFFTDFAKNDSFKSYGVICSPQAAPAS